jgi:hypothetical protein
MSTVGIARMVSVNGNDPVWRSDLVQSQIELMICMAPKLHFRYVEYVNDHWDENSAAYNGYERFYDIEAQAHHWACGVEISASEWNIDTVIAVLQDFYTSYLDAQREMENE